jgi:hypothetical protein
MADMEKDSVEAKHTYNEATNDSYNDTAHDTVNDMPAVEAAADPDKGDMYRMGKEQEFRACPTNPTLCLWSAS